MAQEYDTEKALRIAKVIGDRIGEAYSYGNLAALYLSQGKYSSGLLTPRDDLYSVW